MNVEPVHKTNRQTETHAHNYMHIFTLAARNSLSMYAHSKNSTSK